MRQVDANTVAALTGSRSGDSLTVWAWYGGRLANPDPLPISSARFGWDATRQIQTLSLSVDDKDGELAPWLLEDTLGVGGARLQVIYNVGGAGSINMGWYRVTTSKPVESWIAYTISEAGTVTPDTPVAPDTRLAHVSGGAEVQVDAEDLGTVIAKAQFPAPESPVGVSPTIVGEITRIIGDICPVVTTADVVDASVNSTLVYQGDRLNAVQDLCKRINCDYRFNGAGQFEVYPLTPQTPVATLKGGAEGLLVRVDREQKYDSLFNEFYAEGQLQTTDSKGSSTQVPIRGYAAITAGPLRVNGPHGRYPKFYSSTMLTTQAECDAYAKTMRDTQLAGLTTDLVVTCLPLPYVQQGDWVTVYNALVGGRVIAVIGRVKTMSLGFSSGAPEKMVLTVECSYSDVQAAFSGASNLSLAGPVVQSGVVRRNPLMPGLFLSPGPFLQPEY
ncbi:hypothetical protein AB4Z38_07135 [Arthrobacter sp. 2RAF6]|uniref:hypothetical protein n=1 Tax=Arthrobacter sp. 2RAF6 TaxID=3233002 RepID=UPI003F928F5C